MKIELTLEEVSSIVSEKIKEMGYEISEVRFNLKTETRGYGPMEHDEIVFTGATISVRPIEKKVWPASNADRAVVNNR